MHAVKILDDDQLGIFTATLWKVWMQEIASFLDALISSSVFLAKEPPPSSNDYP